MQKMLTSGDKNTECLEVALAVHSGIFAELPETFQNCLKNVPEHILPHLMAVHVWMNVPYAEVMDQVGHGDWPDALCEQYIAPSGDAGDVEQEAQDVNGFEDAEDSFWTAFEEKQYDAKDEHLAEAMLMKSDEENDLLLAFLVLNHFPEAAKRVEIPEAATRTNAYIRHVAEKGNPEYECRTLHRGMTCPNQSIPLSL